MPGMDTDSVGPEYPNQAEMWFHIVEAQERLSLRVAKLTLHYVR